MPTFEVNVAGLSIRLPIGPGGREATSFARLVFLVAPDERSAEDKALTLVALDWNASRWARLNRGSTPGLQVIHVTVRPWWYGFLFWRRGYAFITTPHWIQSGSDVIQ